MKSLSLSRIILLSLHIPVAPHGFLSSPRSRNLVAYEDLSWSNPTTSTPLPEDCPTCLNLGGVLARCGLTADRNYDTPLNAMRGTMPSNQQATYIQGQMIEVEVVLSAHHRGHFIFKGCPITSTSEAPSQACFDEHPLTFVRDELYGAPKDVNFPFRAYVAPLFHPQRRNSNKPTFEEAMVFRYVLQLPEDLVGELVLLQWYYVAGNSGCSHAGYDDYPWPDSWMDDKTEDGEISAIEAKYSVGIGLNPCEEILSEDGNGVPEQFWNCAEITIQPKGESGDNQSSPSNTTKDVGPPPIVNPQPQLQSDYTIVGYFASWQWYDRQKLADPKVFDFRKYSRINFAFFQVNEDGDLWGTDTWADPNLLFGPYNWNGIEGVDMEYCSWDGPNLKVCNFHRYEEGLIYLARQSGAEIWPSIGGWSLSDPFPVMAKNEASREKFVRKCVELIEEYAFDGIDVDWEYPGYEAHSGTPDDTESYNLLLKSLREQLDDLGEKTGKFYGLTAALPCGTSNINNIDIATVAKYLTEFNLMTYDFFGAWSPTTGINAPLYDQDWDNFEYMSVDGCVKQWVKGGADPSRINTGLPFYGRGYTDAKGLDEEHGGKPDKNLWFVDDGSPQYFNIIEKLPDLTSVRHELTKTQYAYKDDGGVVSYDDEEAICDKTEYAMEAQLNGFIIWEISGDLMPDLTTPLIDTVHHKLSDPSLDCKTLSYDKSTFSGYSVLPAITKPVTMSSSLSGAESENGAPGMTCPSIFFWGSTQYNGCTGYFNCVNGSPDPSTLVMCPEGTLYDEVSFNCIDSSSVTCSEESSVPLAFSAAADDPVAVGSKSKMSCPSSYFWGKLQYNGCAGHFECINGVPKEDSLIICQEGTLFDELSSECKIAGQVKCSEEPHIVPAATESELHQDNTIQQFSSPFKGSDYVNVETEDYVVPITEPPMSSPKPTLSPVTPKPSPHPVTNKPTRYPIEKVTQRPVAPAASSFASMADSFMQAASFPSPQYSTPMIKPPPIVVHKPASKGQESLSQMLENLTEGLVIKKSKKKFGRLKMKKKKSKGVEKVEDGKEDKLEAKSNGKKQKKKRKDKKQKKKMKRKDKFRPSKEKIQG